MADEPWFNFLDFVPLRRWSYHFPFLTFYIYYIIDFLFCQEFFEFFWLGLSISFVIPQPCKYIISKFLWFVNTLFEKSFKKIYEKDLTNSTQVWYNKRLGSGAARPGETNRCSVAKQKERRLSNRPKFFPHFLMLPKTMFDNFLFNHYIL